MVLRQKRNLSCAQFTGVRAHKETCSGTVRFSDKAKDLPIWQIGFDRADEKNRNCRYVKEKYLVQKIFCTRAACQSDNLVEVRSGVFLVFFVSFVRTLPDNLVTHDFTEGFSQRPQRAQSSRRFFCSTSRRSVMPIAIRFNP
jgi:hypothetical protein